MVFVILLTNVLIRKKRNDEGYSKNKQTYKDKRTTKKVFKKNLCTKEDISSLDEDEVGDSETERVLFMAVEDSNKEDSEEEYEKSQNKLKRQKLTTERNCRVP
jgi:hypothetical protein